MNAGFARCFLGLALPETVRKSLTAVRGDWPAAHLRGSWVRAENFHVTVRFLGDLSREQRDEIDKPLMHAFGGIPKLVVRIAGTGVFPSPRRPRVLWAGLEVLSGDLGRVVEAAVTGTECLGLHGEAHAHRPHVTLVRLRHAPAGAVTDRFLTETQMLLSDAFPVASVALWKSTLRPGGAIYDLLREYPLS